MFVGQIAVVAWFVLRQEGPFDLAAAIHVVGGGLTISLSVIMGLPAVLAALWLAIRLSRTPFADYLALRWTSWKQFSDRRRRLGVLVMGWDLLSRATGREVDARIHGGRAAIGARRRRAVAAGHRVLRRRAGHGGIFARGFLYRGWSETFLRPAGAILLSSLVWTALHLQYDWFFLGEVFSIGLLLGYLRYRSDSIWLTCSCTASTISLRWCRRIWLAGSLTPQCGSRRLRQPVERALQDEDRGVFVDHLGAPGAAHVHADQFAFDRDGGEPLVPQRDRQIGELGKIAGEGAGRLRARAFAAVHVDRQAEHEAARRCARWRWRAGARHRP